MAGLFSQVTAQVQFHLQDLYEKFIAYGAFCHPGKNLFDP